VFKNPVARYICGVTAKLLELAEPRVRSGVWEHTSVRTVPLARTRRTGLAAMVTVYENLVNDGWTDIIGNLLVLIRKSGAGQSPAEMGKIVRLADFQKMEQIRARVDAIVSDSATAEALKPCYNPFCRRPCFHDEYLATFDRPTGHLIDTEGHAVEAITEHSIIANGQTFEVDCLICATGLEVAASYTRRARF
jgi:cyclohexanone monooxygenase